MVAAGHGRSQPIEVRKADGGIVLVEFSTNVIEVNGERLVFAVGRDVTEQVRARSQLMISDRMISDRMLTASVAHELNNPLAAIVANLDLAIEDAGLVTGEAPPLARLRDELRDASEAAAQVREIVKDLRIFSRSEEDRRGVIDVKRVLESTLRMAWNEIRHRAHLVTEYGDVPPVMANESRLGQVFLNLVVNAAQALPDGHADTNEIRVVTSTDPAGRVVVEVRDTGPGIPPETMKRLFTPFFTTKPPGVGTGLGLAICERIEIGLGGAITVESQLNVGTTFKVVLPAGTGETAKPLSRAVASRAKRRGRVLLVDDDPMIGKAIRRALAADHDVTHVTSGRDALDRIAAAGEQFDLILCDLMMPVMTGGSSTRRSHARPRTRANG